MCDSKLSENKVVSRNVAIALGIMCIILTVGLIGAIALLGTSVDWWNKSYSIYVAKAQSEIGVLQTWLSGDLILLNQLKAPKLVMDLGYEDVRPISETPYIHIYCITINVGTNTAYNCRLHLVAYQHSITAVNTYITLDTIEGESWGHVDKKVYYSGVAITSYTIVPEWTVIP
jgi:hypothetical protein